MKNQSFDNFFSPARHCFLLEKFVCHVALPPLVNACSGGREITPEAEAGARLSCHLLLR